MNDVYWVSLCNHSSLITQQPSINQPINLSCPELHIVVIWIQKKCPFSRLAGWLVGWVTETALAEDILIPCHVSQCQTRSDEGRPVSDTACWVPRMVDSLVRPFSEGWDLIGRGSNKSAFFLQQRVSFSCRNAKTQQIESEHYDKQHHM